MRFYLIQGILIGLIVAVPVGPLGLLCINRSLMLGALPGLVSGMGVATADALAAGIAALGISLISDFLIAQQFLLRLVGGVFLCVLGYRIYRIRTAGESANDLRQWIARRLCHNFFPDLFKSGNDTIIYRHLCRLACAESAWSLFGGGVVDDRSFYRLGVVVGRIVRRVEPVSAQIEQRLHGLGSSRFRRWRSSPAVSPCC